MSDALAFGIIGLGNMGTAHAKALARMDGIRVAAVCDRDPQRLARAAERSGATPFADAAALLRSGTCTAVLVATPHWDHVPIASAALRAGLHVLVEKPIAVHKADAERLLRTPRQPGQVFAAMFNQRTNPAYRAIRELLAGGRLGAVRRVQWTITDWFRSQAYYDSGGWRATWAGEGGGVLLNQCPHQLDLLQWLFGLPVALRADCHFGKHHAIEVEDEVTAVLEYAGGATGVFVTSTGEAPGSNRLEVATEHARVVHDTAERAVVIDWNATSVSEAIAGNRPFEAPATRRERISVPDEGGQHGEVLANFVAAIRDGTPLIAPAEEGIASVELANAMLLSAWTGRRVALPISARGYAARLRRRVATSQVRDVAPAAVAVAEDMAASFGGTAADTPREGTR